MNPRLRLVLPAIMLLALPAHCLRQALASPSEALAHAAARRSVARGLDFLQRDAEQWRRERECSTCHHGTLTSWALAEGQAGGYALPPGVLSETGKWTTDRLLARIDLPRDTRPGWSMVNTPAMYLSLSALLVPGQGVLAEGDLRRVQAHLVRHQEADGAWAWSSAPPQNRPPPFFESDEVATLLALTVLGPPEAGRPDEPGVPEARAKALAWLRSATPSETTQAATVRLLRHLRWGDAPGRQAAEQSLIVRQNADGGWGQLPGAPSDAYATGQALYVLSLAGVSPGREEIRRGVSFLIATQKPDGSWPMTPRAQPGARPATNASPITHLGAAWATMGLIRATGTRG